MKEEYIKPTRFFFNDPNLPEPDRNRLVGVGKQFLFRLHDLKSTGTPVNTMVRKLDDGTVFSLDITNDIDNVIITTPKGKEEPPVKQPEFKETYTIDFVFLLDMVDASNNRTGTLIVDRNLAVLYYAKDELLNRTQYYGFECQWGGDDDKNKVTELERRSDMDVCEWDNTLYDPQRSETDTLWVPGLSVNPLTLFPVQPAQLNHVSPYHVYVLDSYAIPPTPPDEWETMGNNTFELQSLYGTGEGKKNFNVPSYLGSGEIFDDMVFSNDPDVPQHFLLLFYDWRRLHYGGIMVGGMPWRTWEHWEISQAYSNMYPYPEDGKQTRQWNEYVNWGEYYYLQKTGEDKGPYIINNALFYETLNDSTVYGVWEPLSSETIQTKSMTPDSIYWQVDSSCTVTDPLYSVNNTVFPQFERWMLLNIIDPEFSVTEAHSPCIHSNYYRMAPWHTDTNEIGRYEAWFDDGLKYSFGDYNIYRDEVQESFDMGIYDWDDKPIYALDVPYPIVEGYYIPDADENIFHSLAYYYDGEIKVSDQFPTLQDSFWEKPKVDAFSSVSLHNCYWNGLVRVASHERTTYKETEG